MLKITSPSTGMPFSEVDEDSSVTVHDKVRRAREAQGDWARRGVDERAECLRRAAVFLAEDRDKIAVEMSEETGKPLEQSRLEVDGALPRLDVIANHAKDWLSERTVNVEWSRGIHEAVTWEPLGVVAHLSTWSYPLLIALDTLGPALVAGNSVLYKPSEYATLIGLRLAKCLHRAGVPPEVLPVVVGGPAVGTSLVSESLDGVFATVTSTVGRKLSALLCQRPVRFRFDGSGKDAAYVRPDVKIEEAAIAVSDGAFYNTGQSCSSLRRIYVHQDAYHTFLDAFVAEVKALPLGNPLDEGTYLGAITRESWLSSLEIQTQEAVQLGGRLLTGGKRADRRGRFFEATVIADCSSAMKLMREETLGPLVGIERVASDEEAILRMNETEYGLGAAVFTKDRAAAEKILGAVNVGNAFWNCGDRSSPHLPWAGRRHSGNGLKLGKEGFFEMLRPKAWHRKGA